MEARELVGVILAGGRSSRMGRPKEAIVLDGEPLLQRQQRLLHEVGIRRVLLSMGKAHQRAPGKLPGEGGLLKEMSCEMVYDPPGVGGPLAGILASLRRITRLPPDEMSASGILVVAVDMPRLSRGVLEALIEATARGRGAAPKVEGRWEPLAAVYPREALGPATRLADGPAPSSPSGLLDELETCGQMEARAVQSAWVDGLRSWNTPDDLPGS
ncbi:MAG: molybdenum cofactor guanylyltransferase [Gemmatimonadota bacterium]